MDFAQVKSSINEFPINHPSQLLNPFLGLPLEAGKCESCGTAEPGQCEGKQESILRTLFDV